MGLGRILATILLLSLSNAFAAENRANRGSDEIDDSVRNPLTGESDIERMDRFVIFNEKLKSAVCDENFISKAPSLESITSEEGRAVNAFSVGLGSQLAEHELMSFMLGDSLAGIYSEFVRDQVQLAYKNQGLAAAVQARNVMGDQFLEAQNAVQSVKRRVSLDVCEALVNLTRLRQLLHARPSRFIEAAAGATPLVRGKSGEVVAEIIDTEGRFGQVGDRVSTRKKFLVPGWIEAFEIDRLLVQGAQGGVARAYRRIANPVTNNTQSIEVMSAQGVPLGILMVSRDPTSPTWATYRNWAELPEARLKQIETYRSRIEFEAVRAVGGLKAERAILRDKVRNLQEFYKNLLQAYQLFPNEKQFETYGKSARARMSLDDVLKTALGGDFLASLRQARVNGSYVHIGLFKPDPKLHAIYAEYSERLTKLLK